MVGSIRDQRIACGFSPLKQGEFQPFSPDLNRLRGSLWLNQRLWLRLKADFFSDFIAKSPDELTQRLCHTLTSFMNDSENVASQCAFRK